MLILDLKNILKYIIIIIKKQRTEHLYIDKEYFGMP